MYRSLSILPRIQFRLDFVLSGALIGLTLDGSCASEAINALSARVSSWEVLPKYVSAADSIP